MSLPFGAPHVDPADLVITKGTAALTAFKSARAARATAAAPPERTTYATPVVRGLARKLGVDLAKVKGTGTAGRITPGDVRAAVPTAPAARAPRPAPEDAYPSSWKHTKPQETSTASFAAPHRAGTEDAYPAHWDTSPIGDSTPAPAPGAKAADPAPRPGKHAGTAYPADWAL
ncbi:E3 binding domain-containing protein [Microbacterium sp.]|uniref:E3 binding domain-containing protein n=1 Tax=Microbacterium sp. TaxID=51671 RepID=UPI0035685FFA